MRAPLVGLCSAAITLAAPARAAAQVVTQPPSLVPGREASFAVLRGADTIATERFVRTAGRVHGELAVRLGGVRLTYDMTLGPAGTVSRIESAVHRAGAAPDAPPAQRVVARFDGAGVALEVNGGAAQRSPLPEGSLPFINLSSAVLEQLLLRARAVGGDSARVTVFMLSGGQSVSATVRRVGADSAVLVLGPELRMRVGPDGELLGAAVPSQGVRFERVAAVSTALTAPDYSAPAGAPYTAEDVVVRNEAAGVSLAGTLTLPKRAAGGAGVRVPAVVMITGSGPQDRDEHTPALPRWRPFRQIADTLSRSGIAVLRLDDRGVGGSDAGPPGATSADFAGDIRAAVAFLRARPEIDPARVGLVGHSEGGIIAPMVAAGDPRIRAVALIAAPSRNGRTISDAQVAQSFDEAGLTGARRDSLLKVNDRARDSMVAAMPWMRFWFDHDPLPTARRVRAPVLVLQGATDRQVSADQAEELAAAVRAGGNRDVTVRVVPEVNHLMVRDPSGAFGGYGALPSYEVHGDVIGALAAWLATKLR